MRQDHLAIFFEDTLCPAGGYAECCYKCQNRALNRAEWLAFVFAPCKSTIEPFICSVVDSNAIEVEAYYYAGGWLYDILEWRERLREQLSEG